MARLAIDLPKMAKIVNAAIPFFILPFALLGYFVSFYFHFATVFFILLTIINTYYLKVQKKHTLLRNFGILAQVRYLLESIGPELRQYLYMSDTQEKPFNRMERTEIYKKAKDVDATTAFGSLEVFAPHDIKIRPSLYPVSADKVPKYSLTFGEERKIKKVYTISKPFMISAMSYGSLGSHAVRALARGAKRGGIPMNTGEGGFPKYHLMENCDIIFQMGTAKFGVRNDDHSLNDEKLRNIAKLPQVKMIEIKFSQGAKPGKGGLLPKEKVTKEIAELRHVPLGQDVVSPPAHVECTSPKTTVQFIKRVQDVSQLPVGIKICLGDPKEFQVLVREMKRQNVFPDYIALDGAEGGTGAAPKSFMDNLGIPLFDALPVVQEILVKERVRQKTKIVCAGKLINAGKQIMALALGADAVYTARGFMLALGCIQALQCNKNTCPTGITTHDPSFQKGLVIEDKAVRVANYIKNLDHDFYELLAATGRTSAKELNKENLHICIKEAEV